MARNNNNRPRVNNRTRNLSSFIPQPRSSIIDNNRDRLQSTQGYYIDYQEVQNHRDWMETMNSNLHSNLWTITHQTLENLITTHNISEETQQAIRRIWEEEDTNPLELESMNIASLENYEWQMLGTRRADNRIRRVLDREGNEIPRERLEQVMADTESRLRNTQRTRERINSETEENQFITREDIEQATRSIYGNGDQSNSELDESIRQRNRQDNLFENRNNSITDYLRWLSSQTTIGSTQFPPTRNSSESNIVGERFDNIIIIQNSSRNPFSLSSQAWGRGYVILESDNLLSKKLYPEVVTDELTENDEMYNFSDIDVHGGITYSTIITEDVIESNFGKNLHLVEGDINKILIGFDTNHYNSDELFPDRESVLEETTKLALQCAAY